MKKNPTVLRNLASLLCVVSFLAGIALTRGVSYAGKEWISYTTKDGLTSNIVKCIAVDGDEIWIGTDNGVTRFNKKKNRWTTYTTATGLTSNQVNAILVDGDGVWFGTQAGASLFNKVKNNWISYTTREGLINDRVNALAVTDSDVWLGTEGGLSGFNKRNRSFTSYTTKEGLFDNRIKSMLVDGGHLLIATVGPLVSVLDLVTKQWSFYSPEELLYTNFAIASEGGKIWAATFGGGVRAYDKTTKRWTYYVSHRGKGSAGLAKEERVVSALADNFSLSIAADGRYIWLGTFDGVSCFDTTRNKWQTFSTKDGLIDDSVTAIAIDGNYVWFGTDNGISRFNKIIPHAAIRLPRSYMTDVEHPLEIECLAFSYRGIKNYVMEYSIGSFPEVWLSKGIDIRPVVKRGRLIVSWDLKDLPSNNDVYNLRLTVRDKKGEFNRSLAKLAIDTIKPVVTIDVSEAPLSIGLQSITGKFNKGNVKKIMINPGNISADLNFGERTYKALVPLEEGSNKIEATLTDWLGRTAKAQAIIEAKVDLEKPTILVKKEKEIPSRRLIISESLLFTSGSARIKLEGHPILDQVITILQKEPKVEITIEGHTDNVPIGPRCPYPSNLALSKARAKEVSHYLIERSSVSVERFFVKGYGDSRPVASNRTAEGRAKNRRVEIVVTTIE
ncbi:MAG: OmpA family protein [bacterium]